MSVVQTKIAIIGGGLAAHAAAATVAAGGADAVMISPPSPGATALWSGLGQAFGPASDILTGSVGQVGAPVINPRAVYTRREQRFALLGHRRPFHPYWRLGLSLDAIAAVLTDCAADLGYPGLRLVDDGVVLPSAAAAPYPADVAATSVFASAVGRGESVGVVACPALADWYPERLVAALDAADGVQARLVEVDVFDELAGTSEHSVRVGARLAAALEPTPNRLATAVAKAADEFGLDLVILPPCIGRTWAEHRKLFGAITRAASCRVAEAAAARNSVHGWRLDRYLRAHPKLESIGARATAAEVDGQRLVRVTAGDDTVEADAFILATGRWIGGGLPTRAPLREPLLGLDLWLDAAPVANPDEAWPPHLLDEHAWGDHPLFRAGVGVDQDLRPLTPNATALADNVFAAGRMLAGFNPFLDGTAEGVDLVTGRIAARRALAAVGIAVTSTEVAS